MDPSAFVFIKEYAESGNELKIHSISLSGKLVYSNVYRYASTQQGQRSYAVCVTSFDAHDILFLTLIEDGKTGYTLFKLKVNSKGILEIQLKFELLHVHQEVHSWLDAKSISVPPCAVLGFTDGRVLLGYPNCVVFVDLKSGTSERIHEFGGYMKKVDAFCFDSVSRVAVIDNTITPKFVFLLDLSNRKPKVISEDTLQDGINQHYTDGILDPSGYFSTLESFGHRGGSGHVIRIYQFDQDDKLQNSVGFLEEFVPSSDYDDGTESTLVGKYSMWGDRLHKFGNHMIVAANARGILIFPFGINPEDTKKGLRVVSQNGYHVTDIISTKGNLFLLLKLAIDDRSSFYVQLVNSDFSLKGDPIDTGIIKTHAWGKLTFV